MKNGEKEQIIKYMNGLTDKEMHIDKNIDLQLGNAWMNKQVNTEK